MTLKDITLKVAYDSDEDNILEEFYIPALSESIIYKRLAGYFTSTSLAIAAKGLSKFIVKGGKIQLICNVILSQEDFNKIKEVTEHPILEEIEKRFIIDIENIKDKLVKDHVSMLGWMIKNKKLEIKVALVANGPGIQHQKTGILEDEDGNIISFTGSDNETKSGWQENLESFHVFRNWFKEEKEHIESDIARFSKFWNNEGKRSRVFPISEAVKKDFIKIAPRDQVELNDLYKRLDAYTLNEKVRPKRVLFYYQKEAINLWLRNNGKGFFEMATGTGKTVTAINAIENIIKDKKSLGIIIAVPSNPLVAQWKKEMIEEGFEDSLITLCSSDYPGWDQTFRRYILLEAQKNKIFIFTYQSLCTPKIQKLIDSSSKDMLIICDEMHHAGAPIFAKCLNEKIKYRLGLSATPIRSHDLEGTQTLLNYFGSKPLLIFDIGRALKEINPATNKTYLCPYDYYFEKVELSKTEHAEYRNLSRQIAIQKKDSKDEGQADKLRALLISCASEKILILDDLIKKIKIEGKQKKMLFYCQSFKSKDLGEKQIDSVKKSLSTNNLNYMEFTSKFDDVNVRKSILEALKKDSIDAIVSIKCLDEGVDLPEVRTAVILASSSNSAEFIQRRGRVLRNSPGKEKAELYDFLVGPPKGTDLKDSDISLIRREFERSMEYAKHAINSEKAKKDIYSWLNEYNLSEGDLEKDE